MKKRGLGSLSKEKVLAIASSGGRAVSAVPGHMSMIGKLGGKVRGQQMKEEKAKRDLDPYA